MRTRLTTLTAAVIAGAALLGSACTDDSADENRSTTPRPPTTMTSTSTEPSDTSASESTTTVLVDADASVDALVAAGRLARDQVTGSAVVSIDFDSSKDPRRARWEVDVATPDGAAQEVEISADGTEVLEGPSPSTDSPAERAERRDRLAAATIDFEAAAGIVAAKHPAGRITELDLDRSSGRVVWEADVYVADGSKREIEVDASTGEILVDLGVD